MRFATPRFVLLSLIALGCSLIAALSSNPNTVDAAVAPPRILTLAQGQTLQPTNRPAYVLRGTFRAKSYRAVQISLRRSDGLWVQANGTVGRGKRWLSTKGSPQWTRSTPLPPGAYRMTARALPKTRASALFTTRTFRVVGRDPLSWPYPSGSIWNMPRGVDAVLIPGFMDPPEEKTLRVEDDILFLDPMKPRDQWETLGRHEGGWRSVRCDSIVAGQTVQLGSDSRFPLGDLLGEEYGLKPNHSTAIVMPDYTLRETQPLARCGSRWYSQYNSPRWQGDSILTGGMGASADGQRGGGAHGGAFMTAFGGTVRLGEWVRGGNIPHATKIEVWTAKWLAEVTDAQDAYRWPALTADAGWRGYGSAAPTTRSPQAQMGALLTLPNSFDVRSLRSEPARILARSLKRYGTYLVDGTGRDTVQLATEWSPRGRVYDEFQQSFGFTLDGDLASTPPGPKQDFLRDMERIYSSLAIVGDNGRSSIGGRGARLARLAPAVRPVG